jgi:mycothiol synthase
VNAPPGYTVRPLTADDAAAVAELINEFDAAYVEEPDTVDADEVAGWWVRIELETDSRAFFADDGTLAAVAAVHGRREGELDLDAFVRPAHQGRGLGSAVVDWLEEEVRQRGCTIATTSGLTADRAAAELLAARGYECVRHFYRMLIELDEPPPDPDWPAGVEVTTFTDEDEEVLYDVVEDTFSEHWGHEQRDFDQWRATNVEQSWWDPSLVYLVREGGQVVAAEINARRFGGGWVGVLGTRRAWRGRGLGRALLLQAFGELYRRGERRVGLAVDAGNETGAVRLYESVGMRVSWQADVWQRHLTTG